MLVFTTCTVTSQVAEVGALGSQGARLRALWKDERTPETQTLPDDQVRYVGYDPR